MSSFLESLDNNAGAQGQNRESISGESGTENASAGASSLPPNSDDSIKSEPKPKFDPSKLQPGDFYFGKTLGEGAYARVVHAKFKKNNYEFAIKIMEKRHIKKENKVFKLNSYLVINNAP